MSEGLCVLLLCFFDTRLWSPKQPGDTPSKIYPRFGPRFNEFKLLHSYSPAQAKSI